jgi:hypothetical protein
VLVSGYINFSVARKAKHGEVSLWKPLLVQFTHISSTASSWTTTFTHLTRMYGLMKFKLVTLQTLATSQSHKYRR